MAAVVNFIKGLAPAVGRRDRADNICPITLEPIVNPIRTACNHVFERTALQSWIDRNHNSCPLCRREITNIPGDDAFNRRIQEARVGVLPRRDVGLNIIDRAVREQAQLLAAANARRDRRIPAAPVIALPRASINFREFFARVNQSAGNVFARSRNAFARLRAAPYIIERPRSFIRMARMAENYFFSLISYIYLRIFHRPVNNRQLFNMVKRCIAQNQLQTAESFARRIQDVNLKNKAFEKVALKYFVRGIRHRGNLAEAKRIILLITNESKRNFLLSLNTLIYLSKGDLTHSSLIINRISNPWMRLPLHLLKPFAFVISIFLLIAKVLNRSL